MAGLDPKILQAGLMGLVLVAWIASLRFPHPRAKDLLAGLLAAYALAQIALVASLAINHASFPLNLEAMELTMLATVRRVVRGMPIYVAPSSAFIPLAYNPLFFWLGVPFTNLFGSTLQALRLEAICAFAGSAVVIFLAVRKETSSLRWALIAVGLFGAAYRAMDCYLDNAHADSWMMFMALLGLYVISLQRSVGWNLVGVGCGIISFWFKQPGAMLAAGGVGFLTLQRPTREIWSYWVFALILGPILYTMMPGQWLGPLFHEYTWAVPRQWWSFNLGTVRRLVGYFARSFGFLAAAGAWAWVATVRRLKTQNVWLFTLPLAALSALTGALDSESNNNIFIPLATWLIIVGVIALSKMAKPESRMASLKLPELVAGCSFVLLVFNPAVLFMPNDSARAYADLQAYLRTLDGPVYAPWIGPLQDGFQFDPQVHWVPMTDLVRRPGHNLSQDRFFQSVLEPVIHPSQTAYLLMNYPLQNDSALSFLGDEYVLQQDLGDRFKALSTLPRRYNLEWPRYVYVYQNPLSP
jgi:hypothetical protein